MATQSTSGEDDGVNAAFQSLSENDQEVLRLAVWDGLSASEGGALLGCTPDAFSVRLHRAKRRLAGRLEAGAQEPERNTL